MNLEEATRLAKRHEDAYNNDFERYADLYAEDATRAVVWTGRPTPERSPT